MPATLPETFGRYRIVQKLGQGGMGAVYLAEDTRMRRKVALKVPDFDGKESQAVLERFYREARVAAEVRHPGVCRVFDVDCIDGTHFLTMEFMEGTSLHDALRAGQPWQPAQAVGLVIRIADALDALHQKGIVHRDLKPGNVMLQPDGSPVLLDFGLARSLVAVSQKFTAEGAAMGTPAYMAPEQISGKQAAMGPHTDVYALGTILFEMLAGRLPFQPGSLAELYGLILHAERRRPSEFAAVGPVLDQLCLDVLAIDPAKRPPTMPHLIARLQQCQNPTAPPSNQSLPAPAAAPALDPRTPTQPVSRVNTLSTVHRPGPTVAPPTQTAEVPAGNAGKLALVVGAMAAVVLAVVLLTVVVLREKDPTKPEQDSGGEKNVLRDRPDLVVSAAEIHQEWERDQQAARQKYDGKLLEVSGKVVGFRDGKLMVDAEQNTFSCTDPRAYARALPGQTVVLRTVVSPTGGGLWEIASVKGDPAPSVSAEAWARGLAPDVAALKREIDALTKENKSLEDEDASLVNLIAKEDVEIRKLTARLVELQDAQKHNREVARQRSAAVEAAKDTKDSAAEKGLEAALRAAKASDQAVSAQEALLALRQERLAALRRQRAELATTRQELLTRLGEQKALLAELESAQAGTPENSALNFRQRYVTVTGQITAVENGGARIYLTPKDRPRKVSCSFENSSPEQKTRNSAFRVGPKVKVTGYSALGDGSLSSCELVEVSN